MRIGLVGKYVNLPDAYLSVVEALKHGGYAHGAKVVIDWIASEDAEGLLAEGRLHDLDGIVVPGGFGVRGVEGKIAAVTYAREHKIPFLGLCLGLQCAVIEYARNVVGLAGANSSEFDHASPHPVIDLMDDQREVVDKGGTMRLGSYPAVLRPDTIVRSAYDTEVDLRAPPAPLRVQPPLPPPAGGGGAALLGHLARRPAGGVRRALPRRAPVLRRHPGPPRVQEPAQPAPPAVPGAGQGGAWSGPNRVLRGFRSPTNRKVSRSPLPRLEACRQLPPRRLQGGRPGRVPDIPGGDVRVAGRRAVRAVDRRASGGGGRGAGGGRARRAAGRARPPVAAGSCATSCSRSRPGSSTWRARPPDDAMARELAEEIQQRPGRLVKLTTFWNSPGFSTELTHVYIALDLSPCDRPEAAKEEEQDMTIERFPLADTGRLIATGEITDAKTIIGLALAERYLAGGSTRSPAHERRSPLRVVPEPIARPLRRRGPQGDEGERVPGLRDARRRVRSSSTTARPSWSRPAPVSGRPSATTSTAGPGAEIAASASEVWERAEVVCKVKEPQAGRVRPAAGRAGPLHLPAPGRLPAGGRGAPRHGG